MTEHQPKHTDRGFAWWLGLVATVIAILGFLGIQTYRQLLPVSFRALESPPPTEGSPSDGPHKGPSYSHASPVRVDFYNEPACNLANPRRSFLRANTGIEVTTQFLTARPESESSRESLQLAISVCNSSEERRRFKPIFVWYTYYKPGVRGTVHWQLLPSEPPSDGDYLSPNECKQEYLESLDSLVPTGASFLLKEPMGILTLSDSRDRGSCVLDLRQSPVLDEP